MAGLFTNPWTAVVAGGIVGGFLLWKKFSKSVAEKFANEFARDFADVDIEVDLVKDFLDTLGITEKQLEHIRKDVASSPVFLQIGYEAAEAQGKTEQFLSSLESVQTAWGNFNFRDAFEEGMATDNWSALNQAFIDAFGSSQNLVQIFGNDLSPLLIELGNNAGQAASGLDELTRANRDAGREFEETNRHIVARNNLLRDMNSENLRGIATTRELTRAVTESRGGPGRSLTPVSDILVDRGRAGVGLPGFEGRNPIEEAIAPVIEFTRELSNMSSAWDNVGASIAEALTPLEQFTQFEKDLIRQQELRRLAQYGLDPAYTSAAAVQSILQQTLGLGPDLAQQLIGNALGQFGRESTFGAVELLRRGEVSSFSEGLGILGEIRQGGSTSSSTSNFTFIIQRTTGDDDQFISRFFPALTRWIENREDGGQLVNVLTEELRD